jgi:hypothetical protein
LFAEERCEQVRHLHGIGIAQREDSWLDLVQIERNVPFLYLDGNLEHVLR